MITIDFVFPNGTVKTTRPVLMTIIASVRMGTSIPGLENITSNYNCATLVLLLEEKATVLMEIYTNKGLQKNILKIFSKKKF